MALVSILVPTDTLRIPASAMVAARNPRFGIIKWDANYYTNLMHNFEKLTKKHNVVHTPATLVLSVYIREG